MCVTIFLFVLGAVAHMAPRRAKSPRSAQRRSRRNSAGRRPRRVSRVRARLVRFRGGVEELYAHVVAQEDTVVLDPAGKTLLNGMDAKEVIAFLKSLPQKYPYSESIMSDIANVMKTKREQFIDAGLPEDYVEEMTAEQ